MSQPCNMSHFEKFENSGMTRDVKNSNFGFIFEAMTNSPKFELLQGCDITHVTNNLYFFARYGPNICRRIFYICVNWHSMPVLLCLTECKNSLISAQ